MKLKVIVVDLDGVLCHLKPESERNNHTGEEKPIESMVYLVQSLMQLDHIKVLILTGRKEKFLDETIHWLFKHNIPAEIVMQMKSTADKNHIFKREQLQKIKERYDVIAVIDDNPAMIEVCGDLSITLLQVHSGTFQNEKSIQTK